jgi:hypothetical protein
MVLIRIFRDRVTPNKREENETEKHRDRGRTRRKMGYQFIRVETYARSPRKSKDKSRRCAVDVIKEAIRTDSHCKHVASPRKPLMLHGCDPDVMWKNLESLAGSATDRTGKRKLAKDAQILLAGVVSAPIESESLLADIRAYNESKDSQGKGNKALITENMKAWDIFKKKTLEFLQAKYGEALKSVVCHFDESYLHFHFYCHNDLKNGTLNLDGLHDGYDAERKFAPNRKSRNESGKQRRTAHANAMKAFQDNYYAQVAQYCGFARVGPRKRRLKHDEWVTEKKTNQSHAEHMQALELRAKAGDRALFEAKIQKAFAKQHIAAGARIAILEDDIKKLVQDIQDATSKADLKRLEQLAIDLEEKQEELNKFRKGLKI